jgi:poly(3-hydroxybutyrate) depolymerase
MTGARPLEVAVALVFVASGGAGCSAGADGGELPESAAGGMATGTGGALGDSPGKSGGFAATSGGATPSGGSGAPSSGGAGNAQTAGSSGGPGGSGGSATGPGGAKGSGGARGGVGNEGRGGTSSASGGVGFGGGASGGVTAGGSSSSDSPTQLPKATQTCPPIKSGNLTFLGQSVTVWAGSPSAAAQGPLVIYWHATGSTPDEALRGLGQAAISEITSAGGMVAAQAQTNGKGTNTGNNVWYTGDFAVADEIVACAIEQLHIDTRRIYASGFSAGGLQTSWMAYERSGYLAAAVPYSGGLTGLGTLVLTPIAMPQDASNVPAAMAIHGREGSDVLILDFAVQSRAYLDDVKKKGGFAIECDHGGGHMMPSDASAAVWKFMKAHPYKTKPSPYAGGLPAGFPAYCKLF